MLRKIGFGILSVVLFFGLIFVFQQIWNMTLPTIFDLKLISYWQALGLVVLARILFGGFGFRWMNSCSSEDFFGNKKHSKKCKLSKEEKEAVISKLYSND